MNKLLIALPVAALIFLSYLAGTAVTRFELPPYTQLREAFVAAEALFVQQTGKEIPWYVGAKPLVPEDLASPSVRDSSVGVGRYDPDLAFNGLTIYTPIRSQYPIRLIDMQGETVHEWRLPLEQLSGERDDGLKLDVPVEKMTMAYVRLLPDGSLLAVIGIVGATPWGYAVIKVDKDSQLEWQQLRQAHHDLDIAPDGRIFALTHSLLRDPWPGLEQIATPFIDDELLILTPDGEELEVISILDAVQGSPYESMLMYADPEHIKGDLFHVNSVTWLDAAKAAALPNASEGDVLLSFRQIDTLAVLDPEARTIKWASRGYWRMQHDPDVLPNGNLLLFDNRGDDRNGGTSRILEFDPRTLELVWEYPGTSGEVLFTSIYGSQERLPNGNTLISESNNGRILEVTRDGEVAWEYKIPERKVDYKGNEIATVVFADRFLPEQLTFLDAAGSGGAP